MSIAFDPSLAGSPDALGQPTLGEELIRLEDIHKVYHLGDLDVPVLKGVSLTIRRGEMVALMGASGSGKTTLMNILGCLDRPSSGEFWVDGQEASRLSGDERAIIRNTKIGFVFQSFNLLARTSAIDNVTMPLQYAVDKVSDSAANARATALLTRVGLEERLDHKPNQMSGGQQQRVAIARSLVRKPLLLLADEPTGNLDSRTSLEILRMFQQLHAEGITVVLVTHDAEVAKYANRVIYMRDGRIAADEPAESHRALTEFPPATSEPSVDAEPEAYVAPVPVTTDSHHVDAGHSFHLLPRTLRTALHALRRHVMRSALTTLGIIIGVTAVVAIMEIGEGSKQEMQQTISSMGANNLLIQPGAASSGGVTFGSGSVLSLTPDDAEEIAAQCPDVQDVAPNVRVRFQVVYGNRNWVPVYIYGTTPNFLDVRDWTGMTDGEMFTEQDVRNQAKICVVGQSIVRELFQGESPVGKEIRLQNVPFKVVGVLRRKGANMMGMDQDDIVIAPWTTIKNRVSGTNATTVNQSSTVAVDTSQRVNSLNQLYPGSTPLYPIPSANQLADRPQPVKQVNIDQIHVKARSTQQIPQAIAQVRSVLREQHHLRTGEADDFNIRDMTEMNAAMSKSTDVMTSLLICVAAVSLVVGGVGIMNIMLVSVTERTREIGLRMAVGARARNILYQFLTEAIVLCLLGGLVGIAVGKLASYSVNVFLQWTTATSPAAAVAAIVVSVTVGITFGFYPAWKASRLDPIDALRYE